MEVALQENLKYQLELLHFGFIQQQQQNYLPFIPSPLFYHNFTMASSEETTIISDEMSPNGDSMAQIAIPAAGTVVPPPQVAKPPRVVVRCDVCDLSFSSPSVFDSHMAGSKHQKKVKSAELLKSMESMNHEFERNEISGVIRCIVCDITVNSPQLLATHMAGNKHRANAQKRGRQDDGSAGPPAKKPCVDGEDPVEANTADGADALGAKKKKKKKKKSATETAAGTEGTAPEDFKLPDFVSKLESEHGCYYFCNTCNAHCNSQLQLSQHLSSKKHGDKMRELSGGPAARGRRGRGGFRSGPWGSAEVSSDSAPFRGRGRGLRGGRGRGFLLDPRGRGVRGFLSARGGGTLIGRGRGGDDRNSRGSFRGPPRGLLRGPPRGPLRGSSRGTSSFPAPWTDFRGRGRGRGRPNAHAAGSVHQPDAGWGDENWTPPSQVDIENRPNYTPNGWYENDHGFKIGAGQGLKRSYDDSCADNPYRNYKWTEDFNQSAGSSWENASASDGGCGAPSSYGGRASALPKRGLRSGCSDGRDNYSSGNYHGGELGDPSKYVSASSSNYSGFNNYGAGNSNEYVAGGSSNYHASGSNQYGASASHSYTPGDVSSYGVGGASSYGGGSASNHVSDGSSNYPTGGPNSFRGRGGAGNEGWTGANYVGDNKAPHIYTTDQIM